jgi:type I restriction enzyme, S subunit
MTAVWQTVALSDLLEESRDRVPVIPGRVYRIAGVLIAGRGVFWRETIDGADTKYPILYRLCAGQLVYRKLTAWEGPITVVPVEFAGAFVSAEFPTFNVDEERVLADFLRLICQQPSFHDEMRARSTGTAERRNRLAPNELIEIEIELPPLDEQRAIVEICSASERVVETTALEANAALAALRSAREQLLLCHDGWEELPDSWTLATLDDVSDIRSGITKGRRTRGELHAAPFIRAANVQNGYLDLTEIKTLDVTEDEARRFALAPGDVLLIEGGNAEHLGRGWLWAGELAGAVFQNHVFRARPLRERVLTRYLAHAVAASPAREYCLECAKKTTNLASINKSQISEMPVPVPPQDVQAQIIETLDAVRRTAVAANRATRAAERVQLALIEELLSGDRRVRA